MSKQEIRMELVTSEDSGDIVVSVTGLAPIPVARTGKSACRELGGGPLMRIRTTVSEATSDQLLLAQDLFIDALRARWGEWFNTADSDVLDDAAEPVIAINRRGERVVTLLAEGQWPDDEDEVSVRLTRAVFDGTGLAVIWTVRSTKPPAPEPVQEDPVEETVADPVDELADQVAEDLKLKKLKKKSKAAKRLKALIAALESDSDSDY